MGEPSLSNLLRESRNRLQALDTQVVEVRKKKEVEDREASAERLEQLEKALRGLAGQLGEARASVEALERRCLDVQSQTAAIQDRMEDRFQKTDSVLGGLDRQISEIRQRVAGEKEMLATFRQSVKRLAEEASPIRPGDAQTLRALTETWLPKISKMEEQLEGLRELKGRLAAMESQVVGREEFDALTKELKAFFDDLIQERQRALAKAAGTVEE